MPLAIDVGFRMTLSGEYEPVGKEIRCMHHSRRHSNLLHALPKLEALLGRFYTTTCTPTGYPKSPPLHPALPKLSHGVENHRQDCGDPVLIPFGLVEDRAASDTAVF